MTNTKYSFAQEAVKHAGLCGEIDDKRETICIMDIDHEGNHGWLNEPIPPSLTPGGEPMVDPIQRFGSKFDRRRVDL